LEEEEEAKEEEEEEEEERGRSSNVHRAENRCAAARIRGSKSEMLEHLSAAF
jgi:hypothetical protein